MQRYAMLRKKKKNAKNLNISAPNLKFFFNFVEKIGAKHGNIYPLHVNQDSKSADMGTGGMHGGHSIRHRRHLRNSMGEDA